MLHSPNAKKNRSDPIQFVLFSIQYQLEFSRDILHYIFLHYVSLKIWDVFCEGMRVKKFECELALRY